MSIRRTFIIVAMCAISGADISSGSPMLFPVNGHYYDFINVSLSWNNAATAAQQQTYLGVAGHLTTLTTATEQSFVYDQIFLPNLPVATEAYAAWLGGYQPPASVEPAGSWTWITGESWNYVNWGEGEPNNGVGFISGAEDKLAMWGNGYWNDFVGSTFGSPNVGPIGYLVEFDVVPEPCLLTLLGVSAVVLTIVRRRKDC